MSDISLSVNQIKEINLRDPNSSTETDPENPPPEPTEDEGELQAQLQASNFTYFKIVPNLSGYYVVSFPNSSGKSWSFNFINSDVQVLPGDKYNDQYIISVEKENVYYIGIKTGVDENTAIKVKRNDNFFQFKITDGKFGTEGEIFSERKVRVTRGYTYYFAFLINGEETNCVLESEDLQISWGEYGIELEEVTEKDSDGNDVVVGYKLDIPLSCPIGGNGIMIKAWKSQEDSTIYSHILYVIPEFEDKLESVSLSNSEDIVLTVKAPQYVSKIDYLIELSGRSSTGTISIPESKYSSRVSETSVSILSKIQALNSSSPEFAKITITKVYYCDALKNQIPHILLLGHPTICLGEDLEVRILLIQ